MPISWREKIVLFKIESSYGVDPVPTGAANAMLVTNARLTPMEGNDVSRDLDTGYMGAQPTIPAELHAKLEFRVELQGSGAAGTPPAWGPLLRACAMAETISAGVSVTYNPASNSHESGAFYFYVGDTLYKIGGARGTASVEIDAQAIPYLMFSFTGLYSAPAEGTRPAPDLTAFQKPLLATSANTPTFTIGGTAFVMRRFKFDLGNEVQNRFLLGNAAGTEAEAVLITGRSEAVEATVEAVPLTTFDPYALAAAQSALALSLVHGTEAGKIATLSAPAAQIQRPQGLENAQNVLEWPLRLVPLKVAGNDQFTLTLT